MKSLPALPVKSPIITLFLYFDPVLPFLKFSILYCMHFFETWILSSPK